MLAAWRTGQSARSSAAANMANRFRTSQDAVDVSFVANTFAISLADPHNPQLCMQCLLGCVVCTIDNYHIDYETQRTNHAEYFDACARFITAPRSEEEHSQSRSAAEGDGRLQMQPL